MLAINVFVLRHLANPWRIILNYMGVQTTNICVYRNYYVLQKSLATGALPVKRIGSRSLVTVKATERPLKVPARALYQSSLWLESNKSALLCLSEKMVPSFGKRKERAHHDGLAWEMVYVLNGLSA